MYAMKYLIKMKQQIILDVILKALDYCSLSSFFSRIMTQRNAFMRIMKILLFESRYMI